MTEEQVKDWLYRLRSEIDFMSVNPEHRENFKIAIDEGIKAFDTVKEFEKAQIITGGRLNGRAFAYKCGLEDGERKALEKQSDDCVSRQAVMETVDNTIAKYIPTFIGPYEKIPLELARAIKNMPPVTPTHCIATVKFSKEELREICNERIEIECTHGTCKDCFYYNIDEDGRGYHCEKYGHTRFPVYADFYCKDFEKRGDSDGSIHA